jgi:hypothetical protein
MMDNPYYDPNYWSAIYREKRLAEVRKLCLEGRLRENHKKRLWRGRLCVPLTDVLALLGTAGAASARRTHSW